VTVTQGISGMPASDVSVPQNNFLRRFRRDLSGASAIEFAMVGLPFFALLFAIIEVCIFFFASQLLETAIQDSGRLIYTAQAQNQGMTAQDFKDNLCPRVAVLMNCAKVYVDVKYYPADQTITITDPITAGKLDTTGFKYEPPPAGSTGTVVARVFYAWPLFVTGAGFNISNITDDSGIQKMRLLAGTYAFHVEPSP
jgi:Flp pilus assembly protein TadG